VSFLNTAKGEWLFPVTLEQIVPSDALLGELGAVLLAAMEQNKAAVIPQALLQKLMASGVSAAREHRELAKILQGGERSALWLGALALRHPRYAELREIAVAISACTGAILGVLSEGANAGGAWLAGAVPHRDAAGLAVKQPGLNARQMLESPLSAYLLVGGAEPWRESPLPSVAATLAEATCVIALSPFADQTLREIAHVILPVGTFAETSGTFVNLEGFWQSFAGVAQPVGEARPAWKVLRVLGNLLGFPGYDYQSSEAVRTELQLRCEAAVPVVAAALELAAPAVAALPVAPVSLYDSDALVRRAPSLQRVQASRT